MNLQLIPDPAWPTILMAVVIFADAVMSVKPLDFIRECYRGVGWPLEWGWALVVIKVAATAGLIVGLWVPGVALTTHVALVCYFLAAAAAHLRARNTGMTFWVNCLGMLVLTIATGLAAAFA